MNAPSYFEIQADDTSRAVTFYREFWVDFYKAEGLPIEYWRIETEGPRGGLLKRPAKTPPPQHGTNAFVCSMEVVNFDATAAKILSAGGQIAMPKFAVPGVCWQGYFIDTEWQHVRLFQPASAAKVSRFACLSLRCSALIYN